MSELVTSACLYISGGVASHVKEQVVQHYRTTEQAERHQSMEMGVYVKQTLAHFMGMLDKAYLDKGARFPGPQDHLV